MAADFIIIEDDPLIRMDLEGLIAHHFPTAQLASAASHASAHQFGSETTIIARGNMVSSNPQLLAIVKRAISQGSHIVVYGRRQESSLPVTFLDFPFTDDLMLEAISRGATNKFRLCG